MPFDIFTICTQSAAFIFKLFSVSHEKYTTLTMKIRKFFINEFEYDYNTMKYGGQACVFKNNHPSHG